MPIPQSHQAPPTSNLWIAWRWPLKLAMLVPFIACIIVLTHHNLHKTDLWYDESGQFWMALGLNHYSPPFSAPGGLSDIIANNISYNMDPGGFTLILRAWIELFGTSIAAIRSLPLLFFLLSCIILWQICLELKLNPFIICLSPYLLLLDFLNRHYAFEVRAYSAESFAWLVILLLTIKLQRSTSTAQLRTTAVLAGITSSLLLGLRYSIIVPVAAQAILFFLILFNRFIQNIRSNNAITTSLKPCTHPSYPEAWLSFGTYLFFIAGTCLGIYAITLSHQISGGDPPGYVQELLLSHGNISTIFFKFGQIKTWLPVLVLFVGAAVSVQQIKSRSDLLDRLKSCFNPGVNSYCLFTAACIGILLLLSIKAKYPLSWDSRWDIGIHTICLVAPLILLHLAGELIQSRRVPITFLAAGLFISIAVKGIQQSNKVTWVSLDNSYDVITKCIATANSGHRTIAVDQSSAATVRYLYEHGPLKKQHEDYHSIHWISPKVKDGDLTTTKYNSELSNDEAKSLKDHDYVLMEANIAPFIEPILETSHERCPASAATVLLRKTSNEEASSSATQQGDY